METNTEKAREILNNFLEKWTFEKITSMSLEEYVSIGDKNTFCQYLETKTKQLGGIGGVTSSKFGIYKRKDIKKRPKNLENDEQYSWRKIYGKTKEEAFKNIKNEILKIIEYSRKGTFEKLDDLHLTQFVKWKIAYLYSNERLIPIFTKAVLSNIAEYYGLKHNNKTKRSEIQNLIIENKPSDLSIYEFAEKLLIKFGKGSKKVKTEPSTKREGIDKKNTKNQKRKESSGYVTTQKHNELQNELSRQLKEKYGKQNVILEENYVDIKVKLPDELHFYEVKSRSYASDCVKDALGQIMRYAHQDDDNKEILLFVAGQYAPNKSDQKFIDFVKQNLKIKFEYVEIKL